MADVVVTASCDQTIVEIYTCPPSDITVVNGGAGVTFASRAETDAGILTTKALNPDVGAYAYDRFRHAGQHEAGKATRTVVVAGGASVVIDGRASNVFTVNLSASFELSIIYPIPGQVVRIRFKQGAGGRLATWPSNFRWPGGIEPQLTQTANAIDVWYGGYDENDDVWEGNLLKDCK